MLKMTEDIFSLPSEEVDELLSLKINDIENDLLKEARALRPDGNLLNLGQVLHAGSQTWLGLDPQTLNTPYSELRLMCRHLSPKASEHILDLGAGYGRLGIVLSVMFPEVRFTGYELVKERVEEGKRVFKELNYSKGNLEVTDLTSSEFMLPPAEYYFIYDYGKISHIRHTLKQLEDLSSTNNFKVIARGKGIRSIIEHEHPWLYDVYPVIREENFSIYSMSGGGSLGRVSSEGLEPS